MLANQRKKNGMKSIRVELPKWRTFFLITFTAHSLTLLVKKLEHFEYKKKVHN